MFLIIGVYSIHILCVRKKIMLSYNRLRMLASACETYSLEYANTPFPDWLFIDDTLIQDYYLSTEFGKEGLERIDDFKKWSSNLRFSNLYDYLIATSTLKRKDIIKLFEDPFDTKIRYGVFGISKEYSGRQYILLSNGPNRTTDIDEKKLLKYDNEMLIPTIINNIYDPTNGLMSRGDIIYAHFVWNDLQNRYSKGPQVLK